MYKLKTLYMNFFNVIGTQTNILINGMTPFYSFEHIPCLTNYAKGHRVRYT